MRTDWIPAGRGVREDRPRWRRRDGGGSGSGSGSGASDDPLPKRWLRQPEPWETRLSEEPYPGAAVLEDFDRIGPDSAAATRVLVRYTVVRLLTLATGGRVPAAALAAERRVAAQHLGLLRPGDWERAALQRAAELCTWDAGPHLSEAIFVAAETAAKRNHAMGAFALYRINWERGLGRRSWDCCGRAATGIARLARMEEAGYSTRLWERRAAVMEARVRRQAEA